MFSDDRTCLSDKDEMPAFFITITRRGIFLSFGPLLFLLTTLSTVLSSQRFSDVRLVCPIRTGLGAPRLRLLLFGYPPTDDAWCCGCWGRYTQQKNPLNLSSFYKPPHLEVRSHNILDKPRRFNEQCLKLRICRWAWRLRCQQCSALVVNWSMPVYYVIIFSCLLAWLHDKFNHASTAATAGPDGKSLKSHTVAPSCFLEESHACLNSVEHWSRSWDPSR